MKFTIAIPAYKASFLKECIDSILAQTFTDFELIIVNDASPENIDEIISSYYTQKIKYYKNDRNFGALNVVDNWNRCLSYSKGEFFVLMGDDDKMCKNYLEEFSSLIEKFPQCDIFHCRTLVVDKNLSPIMLTESWPEFETVYDTILQRVKGHRRFFISDYVYRTETLKKNGGFYKQPLAWASDDISSYIAANKNGIAHTNKPVFIYRRSGETISSKGSVKSKMDAILEEEKWLISFLKSEPKREIDIILKKEIESYLKIYIQKNKLMTMFSSSENPLITFFKWYFLRKRYKISIEELLYALLLSFKEKRKLTKYE